MLRILLLASELTAGSYDITCMPLIRLWCFYRKNTTTIPTESDLMRTLRNVNYKSVEMIGDHVRIAPGQQIITGSFIKAFAVDQAIAFLISNGVNDAIINAGGSTIKCINNSSHANWTINIPDPFLTGEYCNKICIGNQCLSLSGIGYNKLTINGKFYGHILDSSTGLPASTMQVGILTNQAFVGDVLSTALFSVDRSKTEQTIKNFQDHFVFNYLRIEGDGRKISDGCF